MSGLHIYLKTRKGCLTVEVKAGWLSTYLSLRLGIGYLCKQQIRQSPIFICLKILTFFSIWKIRKQLDSSQYFYEVSVYTSSIYERGIKVLFIFSSAGLSSLLSLVLSKELYIFVKKIMIRLIKSLSPISNNKLKTKK